MLLEIMVSIIIITTGLVYVMRVYSTSNYAINRSLVLFESSLLLESKMFEFEEKSGIESNFKKAEEFSDNEGYSWSINTEPLAVDPVIGQKLDLNTATLEISRLKDIKERRAYLTKYSLTTYLNNKSNV